MIRLKLFFKTWLVGCFAVSSLALLPSESQARDCIDKEKVKVYLNRYRWITEPDQNGKSRPVDLCAPSASYKVLKALIALDELGPLTIERDELDQGIIGNDVARFFPDRISEISLEWKPNSQCFTGDTGPVAFVPLYNRKRVGICPSFASYSSVYATGFLLHEARHTDPDDPGHVLCFRGELHGKVGCDPSYEARGAHAAMSELYLRIGRTRSLPKAVRQEARAGLLVILMHRFNKFPSALKPSFVLEDEKRSVFLADENGTINWLFDLKEDVWLLTRARYFATAVNIFDGTYLWYSYSKRKPLKGELPQHLKDYFGNPFVMFSGGVRDVVLVNNLFHCVLDAVEVSCHSFKKRFFNRKLDWTSPLHLGYFNNMLSFTTEDGSLYYYPVTELNFSDGVEFFEEVNDAQGGFKKLHIPHKYLSFFELEPRTYIGLNMSGQVVKIKGAPRDNPVFIESLKQYQFKKAVGPIMWSAKLEEI